MRKHSHARATFSHLMVALIIVIAGAAAIAWALNSFGTGCAAGVPCHTDDGPHQVSYR